jgi:hypothetical protein
MNCNENLPHFNNQSPSQSTISTHQNIHPSPLVPMLSSHERVATTPMMGSPSLHDSCGEIDPLMPVGQHLRMPSSPSISINQPAKALQLFDFDGGRFWRFDAHEAINFALKNEWPPQHR